MDIGIDQRIKLILTIISFICSKINEKGIGHGKNG
jgi:hypothetical protein